MSCIYKQGYMDTNDESGTSTTILDIEDKGDGLKGEEEPNMALSIAQGH
jgi:hypothetical protein